MKARIYNGQWAGNHSENWLNDNQNKEIGGQLVSEWGLTEVIPDESIKKPIWNGSEWIEGAIEEEIKLQLLNTYLPQIQTVFTQNIFKAKCFVIDKQGDESYINAQRESYENKYKVAVGETTNMVILNALQTEADDLGITLEQLKQLIIDKYQQAEATYYQLLALNESCRAKLITHLENSNINKLTEGLTLYVEIVCADYNVKTNQLISL